MSVCNRTRMFKCSACFARCLGRLLVANAATQRLVCHRVFCLLANDQDASRANALEASWSLKTTLWHTRRLFLYSQEQTPLTPEHAFRSLPTHGEEKHRPRARQNRGSRCS